MRPLTLLTMVCLALGATCACGRPNPTDAAAIQSARQVRDALKVPPGERPIETLDLTRAARIAATGKTLGENEAPMNVAGDDSDRSPAEHTPPERLRAIALAQDARLALLNERDDEGRTLLEQSLESWPTVDALEPMAPILAAESSFDELDRWCQATWERTDDAQTHGRVLEICIAWADGETVDELVPWAPAEVREAIDVP